MVDEVRRLLQALPFSPFSVVTSGGKSYHVPTPDHAGISPEGRRVVIWFDDETNVTLAGLHITAIEANTSAA